MDTRAEIIKMNEIREEMKKASQGIGVSRILGSEDRKKIEKQYKKALLNIYPYVSAKALVVAYSYEVLGKTFQEIASDIKVGDRSNAHYHWTTFKYFVDHNDSELPRKFLTRISSNDKVAEMEKTIDELEKHLKL